MPCHQRTSFALLTATACLAVAACSSGTAATPTPDVVDTHDAAPHSGPDAGASLTRFGLRTAMRALWTDHALWTRAYLVSAIAGLPDADAAAERLLRNQDDIGDAIKPFYGAAAGDALTVLLREHITIAAELVGAAKAGDAAKADDARNRWFANADAIAKFLAEANPNWPHATLQSMMHMHLDQTIAEATARLSGDWAADISAYDDVVPHLLQMSDALADGIAAQHPDKVAASSKPTPGEQALHVALRALWQDHAGWTRLYLISAIAGLPDAGTAAERLLRNQKDIGEAIKPYYGAAAGDALAALLHEHITIAAELVGAAKEGDSAKVDDAKTRWYANADAVAKFLADANSSWPLSTLQSMMRTHLDQTIAEATARLGGDWAADIAAYDVIVEHLLAMSDALADGIAKQHADMLD